MRIAHVSDIHIRNLKFHQDYRHVFGNFRDKLVELRVDLVVNTGDTAHTKTNISPEFVDMASLFFTSVAEVCPIVNVLGNHDLNLMNEDRQDAITPVIEALGNPRVVLWKKSGMYDPDWYQLRRLRFWNFGISDVEHWPHPPYDQNHINIGLFHGSIKNCITDSNFRMTHVEYDTDIFEGLDFVMMGDIHKRQAFNDGRAWYAGSMIQQNFGEDPDKGFLLWDIKERDDFSVDFVELKGSRRFYTIRLEDDLRVHDQVIEPGSRIRISPPRQLTLVEQRTVEKIVRKKFEPHDVITLGAQNIGQMITQVGGADQKIENLRDMSVQEQLLRRYLAEKKLPEDVVGKVLDLNRKYHVSVEQREDTARGVNWRVLKMGWNNLYNYGEGNIIDFSQIKGLTGIFAPNASGKSGMVDVITVGMFDANTKEVAKNIHLVNDNKDKAAIILELLANKERYTIQREIERIKYVRKGQEQEWGKTTLDFVRHDRDGGLERLVQESRPDTEKQIRRRFGSFEDFMLTSLFAQWDPMDIIMCKETDRKRILFRFLDLDIFEAKAAEAKEEAHEWMDRLSDLEDNNYEGAAKELEDSIAWTKNEITEAEASVGLVEQHIQNLHALVEELSQKKVSVQDEREITQEELHRLDREIEIAEQPIKKLIHDELALSGEITVLARDVDDVDAAALQERRARQIENEHEQFVTGSLLKEHEKHVLDAQRQTSILKTVPCGDQFPTCRFLTDAFKSKKGLAEHEREVAEFRGKMEELQAEWERLEPAHSQLKVYEEQSERLHNARNALAMVKLKRENAVLTAQSLEVERNLAREARLRFEQARKDIEANREVDREIAETKGAIVARTRHLKEEQAKLAELNKKLGSDQGILARVAEEVARTKEVKDTCTAYEHFMAAMGKDGIALQVLTQKLPLINEEINKVLQPAAEFGVFIEYDPEDQSIRLYLQYGQYKSRLLELGSGAEKFLASVAIRSALLNISNLPRGNMFIIDEGFGKLDPQNLESIQRMFDYLKSVFDHVIVISHTDLMKDMVDNIIEITADDEGYAHVEIGG